MPIADTRLTPLETRLPDRIRTALGKPEIRNSLARIFDSNHADGVKTSDGGPPVSLEVLWRLPRMVLDVACVNKDNVRGMLAELSTFCVTAEDALPDPKTV